MKHYYIKTALLAVVLIPVSCTKFLEIEPPKSSLVKETIFQNNDQAVSVINGIYAKMSAANSYASGGPISISCLAGLSSDEMVGHNALNIPFYENQLTPDNSNLSSVYSGLYNSIFTANSALEGLSLTNDVTPPVKRQLEGEAAFIRAFCYFYLVNLFGPVPLQLTTDYRTTQVASNASISNLYQQIVTDLQAAELLLSDAYPSPERVRPNKSAAQAMLARAYLYLKDWEKAEKYASTVIAKSDTYALVNLDNLFLKNSKEAIWQLYPSANTTAQDGTLHILTTTPAFVSLKTNFVLNAFEENDKRRINWVKSLTVGPNLYYYSFKYKVRTSTTPTEYSMILRLAEQYLIRSEARINQPGKIGLGIADLNIIRERARISTAPNSLPPLSLTLNKTEALLAVERERRVELFAEWGHRWFDLKRTTRSNILLAPVKPQLQPTDTLYPFPATETERNINLKQNEGY